MKQLIASAILTIFIFISCARISSPNGGPIDKTAPVLVKSTPNNYTTNFNTNKIDILFNEYVDLKDIYKQFIISPALEKKATIKPENATTKKISISFNENLKPNTTYVINFGNSIQDHNEGNVLKGLNYVFSTGSSIDSLTIEGSLKNSLKNNTLKNISILLYKDRDIDLNKSPDYYYNTQENSHYKISHLPQGLYNIVALEDINQNTKYDIGIDGIAFLDKPILIKSHQKNTDLNLFTEKPVNKVFTPIQSNKNQLLIGYQGTQIPTIKIKNLNPKDYIISQKKSSDSLLVSFKNDINHIDLSTILNNEVKDYSLNLLKKPIDSLKTIHNLPKTLRKKDSITIEFNNPITNIQKNLIRVLNNQEQSIPFELVNDEYNMCLNFIFNSIPGSKYQIQIDKNALIDVFGTSNKEIKIPFSIFNPYELGEIHLTIDNPKNKQLIVEIKNTTNTFKESILCNNIKNIIKFKELVPDKYSIQVITDENFNKSYDTGNFEEKKQPENIYNFQKIITLRMNSEIHENINID